ncbi:MAG: PAS domain-containing protein [Gammaproteobacteria bacterium]|nr:PAS domain-containing protein [Gammaproteobacteria bacterium]
MDNRITDLLARFRHPFRRRPGTTVGEADIPGPNASLYEREHRALNNHAIVSITDAAGTIIYVNDLFCEISGYQREELIGNNHRLIRSDFHAPEFYSELWRTISSGKLWRGEICNLRKDGTPYWVESTITPCLGERGQPEQYISIRTEITRIKQAEQELAKQKERLRRGQIYANIGTWEWNIPSGDLFWSERIGPLFGYPERELETSYENFLGAVHPDDREMVSAAVNACVEFDEPYDIEHRVVWPDGTVRWLQERGAVVRDKNGQPQTMLGVVQDIDDRKRFELALAEREKQLLEAQWLAHIGNWSADLISGALDWSDEIYRIFGYEPKAITPSVEVFHRAVHPDDRDKVAASEKRAEAHGRHDVVHRIVRPDGTIRYVHELAQAEFDEQGRMVRLQGTVQDVTAREEAAARLQETEERFAFAVEGAGDGIWDWNIPSGEMLLSGNYEPMLGFEVGELESTIEAWINSVHPEDLAAVQHQLQEYLHGKIPEYSIELRMRCKGGDYKWVLCRGTVVERDASATPVRMIGIHSDITQRKQAELALLSNQTKLNGLYQLSPLGIALTDMDGNFIEFNEAFRQICGYPEEELRTLDYWTLTPREYEEQEAAQLESLRTTGRYGPYEKVYRQKDGSLIPIRLNGLVVKDLHGTSHIWSIVEDITESKNAQERLTLFQRIFEASEQCVGITDTDGRMVYMNPAYERLLGYSQDEMYGKSITTFFPDDEVDEYLSKIKAAVKARQSWTGIMPAVTKSGEKVMIASNVGYVTDDSGNIQYLFNLFSDFGEELRRREELSNARDAAERANKAKSEFLSSMSHELRTPMNAILGFAQLMEVDEDLTQEHQDGVHEILKAGRHLLDLINDVLDLAKVESGQLDMSLEPVELKPVIKECLSLVSTLAGRREVRIHHESTDGVILRADRTRLKQVILNLLSNAIKYNRLGGTVTLSAKPEDESMVRILVSDTGYGIANDRLSELFEPFKRLDAENSEIEGTGIGLTLTRRIVEIMGGEVAVESEQGVGSTFSIQLPADEIFVPTVASHESQETVQVESFADSHQYKVLYVEDNPANLKLVAHILGKRKHIHMLTAHLPELGMELAKARLPELIILDINMPGMDGYELLQQLKSDPELQHIPVIALTANAMPSDLERGKRAGFDAYLTKPLDVSAFLKLVDEKLMPDQ